MRTILTFLNDKGLKQGASYRWTNDETPVSGGVFGLALHRKVPYDRLLACCTPEAEQKTWPAFYAEADCDSRIKLVRIAKGETTAEMWQMFDTISAEVQEGETVIFDITHGLRSLPFLVFLFAAYLKSAKRVKIEAIYYGAFELGMPSPVIDLSEFVGILDWLTATDQFVQTGDARRLANLLNPYNENKGKRKVAAETLSDVSLSAFLCQPFKLMERARSLETALLQAEEELTAVTRPFDVLRQRIISEFGAFGGNFFNDVPKGLRIEYRLIAWYFQNNQWIQAVTLAREWLIDAVTHRLGLPINLARDVREQMERAVSGLPMVDNRIIKDKDTGKRRRFQLSDLNEHGRTIWNWPERQHLIDLWNRLYNVRNALDHAEHQTNPIKLGAIKTNVGELIPLLQQLAQKWDMAEENDAP